MAEYTKLQGRLKAERRAVRVLRLEALRERAGRAGAALGAAGLPCAIGAACLRLLRVSERAT